MKRIMFLFSSCIFLICLLSTGCKQKSEQQTDPNQVSKEISIAEAKSKLAEGKYTFIDLRTPEEIVETGKVEGALEINFRDSDFNSKFAALDRDQAYIVYCKAGGRSGKTRDLAKELGFKEIYDMSDGFSKWGD